MGIYDYMNHFWFENENDPCSLSETSLYFYLLYEANRQHWVMPFKVSTQMLVARLNTSKQNVMKAREGLRKIWGFVGLGIWTYPFDCANCKLIKNSDIKTSVLFCFIFFGK